MTLQLVPSMGSCLCDDECNGWLMQDQAPISKSLWWEVMVANWLYYTGRIAKWCTVLGASDTMCMACAPIRGQIPANLVVDHAGPPLEEGAAAPSSWTHSLQIHCNGSTGPRFHSPLGPVWKSRPYNSKIIFKCMNSIMGPIFNIFFWIMWLWVPWTVLWTMMNNVICLKKQKMREKTNK